MLKELAIATLVTFSNPTAEEIDKHLGWVHGDEYSPGRGALGMALWGAEPVILNSAGSGPRNYRVMLYKGRTDPEGCFNILVTVERMYEDQPHTTPDGAWVGTICG